ncbi:MAG: 2-dehydropantoate 2-reductase [Anaerolinea sp.]|nr:2-dehydropantoate 2-reductase [Anaerolinea sp.]
MSESTQKPLKVICFGMGAIGTYIGGSLAANGAQVTFIEKKEFIKDAVTRGIHLNISGNEINVHNIDITSDIRHALSGEAVDAVLIAVKSNDTPSVLELIKGIENDFPPVLCLQNGVENEALIARKLGEEKVIGGSITSAVGRSGLGDIKLEKLRGVGIETGHPISQKLIDWFNLSGLRAKGYESRADMKWTKMLTNLLANATSAILNWTPAQVYSHPLTWRIELDQIRECMDVMKLMHIHLVNLPGTPAKPLMVLLNTLPAGLSQALVGGPMAKGRGAKMPSFHIDLYSGKTTSEVTFLNGAVSRYASKVGLHSPINDGLCRLLEQLAAGIIAKEEFAGQPEKLDIWLREQK